PLLWPTTLIARHCKPRPARPTGGVLPAGGHSPQHATHDAVGVRRGDLGERAEVGLGALVGAVADAADDRERYPPTATDLRAGRAFHLGAQCREAFTDALDPVRRGDERVARGDTPEVDAHTGELLGRGARQLDQDRVGGEGQPSARYLAQLVAKAAHVDVVLDRVGG